MYQQSIRNINFGCTKPRIFKSRIWIATNRFELPRENIIFVLYIKFNIDIYNISLMVIESHAQSTHPGYFSLNFRDARNCDIHDNNTFSILFDPFPIQNWYFSLCQGISIALKSNLRAWKVPLWVYGKYPEGWLFCVLLFSQALPSYLIPHKRCFWPLKNFFVSINNGFQYLGSLEPTITIFGCL